MILVILVVCIGLIALGGFIISRWDFDCEFLGGATLATGIVGSAIAMIAALVLCFCVADLAVIDEKIAMYQEENAKIEQQIAETVKQYQEYESDIFTEVAPDSAIALVALYPDLKSDALVQSQIDVYIKNNEKIKSLKEDKINGSVNKWWLYFGK